MSYNESLRADSNYPPMFQFMSNMLIICKYLLKK